MAEDAIEMTMCGAAAMGVCTAPLLRGLEWFARTHEKLNLWLDERGYPSLDAVHGKAGQRFSNRPPCSGTTASPGRSN